MKWTVIRTSTHSEYAEVEAESYDEAIELAEELDDVEWEEDANGWMLEDWIYEAEADEAE